MSNVLKQRSDASAVHCQDWDLETGEQIILVQQEFMKDCDINVIVDRFLKTGQMIPLAEGLVYGDDSMRPRYEQAKQLILSAENSFNSLPAKIRSRFNNQPELFLQFMDDEENDDEAIRLGLKVDPNASVEESDKAPKEAPPAST